MTTDAEPLTASLAGDGPASELRVAIIGSGPAGFFTAGAAFKAFPGSAVNMFERLPTPWGLLRAGIAPDHENMRVLGGAFDKIAENPRFKLIANVEVGTDISHQELLDHHHVVVYATGAQHGRRLRLPGEHLPNSFTSGQFVSWYNGHPDFVEVAPDFSHERAVVIGNGNVALDVTRMLSRDAEELRTTDIADHALVALSRSQVREVVLLGRRGPKEAAFTLPELVELDKLEGVRVTADLGGIELDAPSTDSLSTEERKLALLAEMASRAEPSPGSRHIHLKFMSQPVNLTGEQRVERVNTVRSILDSSGRIGVGDEDATIEAGLVVTAVGFESSPIPGVPFDAQLSRIPNHDSRAVDRRSGQHATGTYVVGWVKRGPSGVLGTNKKCATETVAAINADRLAGQLEREVRDNTSLLSILADRCSPIDFSGWQAINSTERGRGAQEGRPRVKFVTRSDLIAAASESKSVHAP